MLKTNDHPCKNVGRKLWHTYGGEYYIAIWHAAYDITLLGKQQKKWYLYVSHKEKLSTKTLKEGNSQHFALGWWEYVFFFFSVKLHFSKFFTMSICYIDI